MNLTKYVFVTGRFQARHRWVDAPSDVYFLEQYHRHMFHVELRVKVNHDDREVEFFTLKNELDSYCRFNLEGSVSDKSCEMFANEILNHLSSRYAVARVTVSEDGENGAIIKVNS